MALSPAFPLAQEHDLSAFDCGMPALDDWLKQRARRNESRFSRTYVVCEGASVVGFYSVAAGAVDRAHAPGKLRRNAPDAIPVSVLGRLAVTRTWRGRGLGAALLSDALRRIAFAAEAIGIAAVLVQAKDENARSFYLACAAFLEYPADSRILFLAVATVLAAAGADA